jgi:hypothetical protein
MCLRVYVQMCVGVCVCVRVCFDRLTPIVAAHDRYPFERLIGWLKRRIKNRKVFESDVGILLKFMLCHVQAPVANITNAFIRLKHDSMCFAMPASMRPEPLGDRLLMSINGRRLLKLLPVMHVDSSDVGMTTRRFQLGVHLWPSADTESMHTLNSAELGAFQAYVCRVSTEYDAALSAFHEAQLLDDTLPRTLTNLQLSSTQRGYLSAFSVVTGFRPASSARVVINGLERRSIDGDIKTICSSMFLVGSDAPIRTMVGQILSFFRVLIFGKWNHVVFANVRIGGHSSATDGVFFQRDPEAGSLMCLPLADVRHMFAVADHPFRNDLQCALTC